jgi:hypothetical protein
MTNFKAGDRVAYSSRGLRTSMYYADISGCNAVDRRGEFVRYEVSMPTSARVRWDDFEATSGYLAHRYGLAYVADARENGQLVYAGDIRYALFKGEWK